MEGENKDKVVLRKIALKEFIDTLVNVYNSGADYIDLVGNNDDNQDTIGIIVHDEYMSNDPEQIEIVDEDEEPKDEKLSDDDIKDLL